MAHVQHNCEGNWGNWGMARACRKVESVQWWGMTVGNDLAVPG